MARCDISRVYPLCAAAITLIYSALTAVLSTYIPNDPLYVGPNISTYAWIGCILSLLGSVGVVTKRPSWIKLFSHFLLADAFISALCRLFLTELFASVFYTTEVCSPGSYWTQGEWRHTVVTGAHVREQGVGSFSTRGCQLAMLAVHTVVVAVLVLASAAQVSLAVVVRRFGIEMERKLEAERQSDGCEKTRLPICVDEKISLAVTEEAIPKVLPEGEISEGNKTT